MARSKVARPTFWLLTLTYLILTGLLTAKELGWLGADRTSALLQGITLIGGAIVLFAEMWYNGRLKLDQTDTKMMVWNGAELIVAIFGFFMGLGVITATQYIPNMFTPVLSIMRVMLLMFMFGEVFVVK